MLTQGYCSRTYAESLAFIGAPIELPQSGGWLIRRPIPDSAFEDAMGVYPYLCCARWDRLPGDLAELADKLISISAIADPLGAYDSSLLSRSFSLVRAYKPHFVIDTSQPLWTGVKRSHWMTAHRAAKKVTVTLVEDSSALELDWLRLYGFLCSRHGIDGVRRFTPASLIRQLSVPGTTIFRAEANGRTIGLDVWYVQSGCAHGHLAAFDETGYQLRASYATKLFLIEYFHSRASWINLGAAPDDAKGLIAFKSGWTTETRNSWFCGKVFDNAAYRDLTQRFAGADDSKFFPAYRRLESF